MTPIDVTFIIPVHNEKESLPMLCEQITEQMTLLNKSFEIILVDDGSTDGSDNLAADLAAENDQLFSLPLRGNYGKTAALAAGFDHANGELIFTMDADLQDDPAEIPNFIRTMGEGYDVVSGYKKVRNDPLNKVVASRIFNALVRKLTGTKLHDVNCGFKCYRREVIAELDLYGDMHRFIPVLAHWKRFKIGEIEVTHKARQFGSSHYGLGRIFTGFIDLMTVSFLLGYEGRPVHWFAKFGIMFGSVGFGICSYLSYLWLQGMRPIGNRPLLFLGIMLIIIGFNFFATGLIAQLIINTQQRNKPYALKTKRASNPEVL